MFTVDLAIKNACKGLDDVDADLLIKETKAAIYEDISSEELSEAMILTARAHVEEEPNYSYVAARLLLAQLRHEAFLFVSNIGERDYFARYIHKGISLGQLDERLGTLFDLDKLTRAIKWERDDQFKLLGLQTLYDRYLIHSNEHRYEMPQAFFMRVAMGLAIQEDDPTERAIEFYELLSSFDFMASTPTLFNSGTPTAQLSSCFLTTVDDSIEGITNTISNNAKLSKFSGGLGNDWTPVRGTGSLIKGTNGKSSGVVPFLKVAESNTIAWNQCFDPDTLVYVEGGVKRIDDIRKGDLVLGISGKYREVLDAMLYDEGTGKTVEVDVKHSVLPTKVTSGHPFYAIQGVPYEGGQKALRWLDSGRVAPDWVAAGDLRKGDFIAQVIPSEIVPVEGFSEEDARLYGIILGDGSLTKNGYEWAVCGNPKKDTHLNFVRDYLTQRGIHFWESQRDENYTLIKWSYGRGLNRDEESGRWVKGHGSNLPFSYEDIYNTDGRKHIARRFSHLPHAQALQIVRGLIETDGNVSRGKEITFCNTSVHLAEGVRYQMLRLGVPTSGQFRTRPSKLGNKGTVSVYDIRIPAVRELADLVGAEALTRFNWFEYSGMIWSRVRDVREVPASPVVHDLIVESDESYMITSGLVHNGGMRKGATCAYLETWHIDIEDFLDLRKNTGDDRRRTHDMNTANWVPDLFMQRVKANGEWTLFSPDEVPELHDSYGEEFERNYISAELLADAGQIKIFKRVQAKQLWRKMLTMLFETGHPWITFKDPINERSPQRHSGVVHSSNLCTEITLNTTKDEVAVCNLGSVNIPQHVEGGKIDRDKLERTITTAIRMLDNVIDINYYTIPEAERSNMKHRPIGLGMMGFHDALYKSYVGYDSDEAVEFADEFTELYSYYAIKASAELARERGAYQTFEGSLWSKGVLPIDTIQFMSKDKEMDQTVRLPEWNELREFVKGGMRNSNVMAIAPTATIANITGVSQGIDPIYQNLYVKSSMSGNFTTINEYLVRDLKDFGLWNEVTREALKIHDGSLQNIGGLNSYLKNVYKTAFEIDPKWLVEAASRRQKWLDQAQSLNLYMAEASGPKLDRMYFMAWEKGLKTTYYLRSQGATHVEKSTIKGVDGKLNSVSKEVRALIEDDCEACT